MTTRKSGPKKVGRKKRNNPKYSGTPGSMGSGNVRSSMRRATKEMPTSTYGKSGDPNPKNKRRKTVSKTVIKKRGR